MGVSFRGWGAEGARRWGWQLVPPAALIGVQLVFFGVPAGQWVRGVTLGLLVALLALGMALV